MAVRRELDRSDECAVSIETPDRPLFSEAPQLDVRRPEPRGDRDSLSIRRKLQCGNDVVLRNYLGFPDSRPPVGQVEDTEQSLTGRVGHEFQPGRRGKPFRRQFLPNCSEAWLASTTNSGTPHHVIVPSSPEDVEVTSDFPSSAKTRPTHQESRARLAITRRSTVSQSLSVPTGWPSDPRRRRCMLTKNLTVRMRRACVQTPPTGGSRVLFE